MSELLDFFETRKNDQQERSWSLHEDVAVIEKKLQELLAIMVRPATLKVDQVASFSFFALKPLLLH